MLLLLFPDTNSLNRNSFYLYFLVVLFYKMVKVHVLILLSLLLATKGSLCIGGNETSKMTTISKIHMKIL